MSVGTAMSTSPTSCGIHHEWHRTGSAWGDWPLGRPIENLS